jgi:hypothetical protein
MKSSTKPALKIGGGAFLLLAAFCIWYSIASNYGYDALSGTYIYRRDGESYTLHLYADQAFVEEINRAGSIQKVGGRWRRYGEAHVSFTKEFLPHPKEELNESGEAHGQFEKTLGIIPKLVVAPLPNGPTLHRERFDQK